MLRRKLFPARETTTNPNDIQFVDDVFMPYVGNGKLKQF